VEQFYNKLKNTGKGENSMRNLTKTIYCLVAIVVVLSFLVTGCENTKKISSDNEITITVGGWPLQNDQKMYPVYAEREAKMKERYPHITIQHDEWSYDVKTFLPKAASGQLPTCFYVPFTEVDKLVKSNYISDITAQMKEYGYADSIREDILELVSREGKIYALPYSAYIMGLFGNISVFAEAGELNQDGYIDYPKTFEELGELAGRIKKKTGKAGFILSTMNNGGGWQFMNIAWAYGTKFMKQDENGRWIATFDSDECAAALQFVKDLKWKYNALSDNVFIDNTEARKMYATNQGAMMFGGTSQEDFKKYIRHFNMDKDNISLGAIPAGPAGKFALLGGALQVISSKSTPEEIDAAFKWFEFCGYNIKNEELTEEQKQLREQEYQSDVNAGYPVGIESYSVSKVENSFEKELRKKYCNIDKNKFKEYELFEGITVKQEEPVNCQELYSILDSCIQAVLTDPNADVREILKKANSDFQLNYLDKAE